MKKLLLAGLLVLTPQLALAESENADTSMELLEFCKAVNKEGRKDSGDYFDSGYCLGVMNTYVMKVISLQWYNISICMPAKATVGQAVKVFQRYAEKHPARLHESSHDLIREAFIEAWPCGK